MLIFSSKLNSSRSKPGTNPPITFLSFTNKCKKEKKSCKILTKVERYFTILALILSIKYSWLYIMRYLNKT